MDFLAFIIYDWYLFKRSTDLNIIQFFLFDTSINAVQLVITL